MNDNKNKSYRVSLAILPAFFIVFCVLNIIGYKEKISEFSTKFMLRKIVYAITMNSRFFILKDNFYNQSFTKDHYWLSYIEKNSLDDFQNVIPFTSEELQQIQNNLDSFAAELDQMGIKFYVIIPPNKNTIYPEYLLPDIPILADQSRLSQLIEFQRDHGSVKIIDVRNRLNELKKTELVYYQTDTHWNPRGAYEGYRSLIEAIQKDFPSVIPIELEECNITNAQKLAGDISKMAGWLRVSSTFTEIAPVPNPQISARVEYIDGVAHTHVENAASDLPRAIAYRDSFFTALQPFLSHNFREITDIWTYTIDMDLIRQEMPDIVIILITERNIQKLLWFPN